MLVRRCRECPFFHEQLASALSVFMGAARAPQGVCSYHVETDSLIVTELGMPPGPEHDAMIHKSWSRMVVRNAQEIPPDCPLRQHDVLITIRISN